MKISKILPKKRGVTKKKKKIVNTNKTKFIIIYVSVEPSKKHPPFFLVHFSYKRIPISYLKVLGW